MTPETRLVNALVKHLRQRKANGDKLWWIKIHGSPLQRAGAPDLLICFNGRFVAVEVKTPEGKATRLQIHTLKLINEAMGVADICRSVQEWDLLIAGFANGEFA